MTTDLQLLTLTFQWASGTLPLGVTVREVQIVPGHGDQFEVVIPSHEANELKLAGEIAESVQIRRVAIGLNDETGFHKLPPLYAGYGLATRTLYIGRVNRLIQTHLGRELTSPVHLCYNE